MKNSLRTDRFNFTTETLDRLDKPDLLVASDLFNHFWSWCDKRENRPDDDLIHYTQGQLDLELNKSSTVKKMYSTAVRLTEIFDVNGICENYTATQLLLFKMLRSDNFGYRAVAEKILDTLNLDIGLNWDPGNIEEGNCCSYQDFSISMKSLGYPRMVDVIIACPERLMEEIEILSSEKEKQDRFLDFDWDLLQQGIQNQFDFKPSDLTDQQRARIKEISEKYG